VKLAEISTASIVAEDLELTIRTGTAPGGAAEVYATLAAAAEDHRKLRIVYYTGSTGRESARVIHPWALVQSLGAWYLVAMCETAGQERVFRLDRIREIEPVDESFTSPVTFSGSVTPDLSALGVAEVRFVAGAPLPDDHAWPGIVLEAQPDGSTLARVPYQTTSWLARRVVAYLGEAEVIGPDAVRTAVRALAAEELSTAQHA
jgi:predicted DNA-binding transcriptional regulator YafY